MGSAERTLVKSQPELWQLIDQPELMEGWMSALLGRAGSIAVTERDPENRLAWEAEADGARARIEVTLAGSGWGTTVTLQAEGGATPLEGWSEVVLDELSAPRRRPFQGVL